MNVNQLELRDARDEHRMDAGVFAQPGDELLHQGRNFEWRWRRVNNRAGRAVGHVVLNRPICARRSASAAHTFDKPFVNFANERLGDWLTAMEILGYEIECAAIVEQFAYIVRPRLV